ncbi:hypothetical protein LSH36_200g00001 [Paralvinella palmiformis]|uniref:Uncharacterized protein n=1 Tax=Paralvinella palmiformis TaxID=53620 RepID=A0AAD9N7J5_9ANNE|nr:hypothetical protein LSH36_200g00001 [Paralvinella palmiformis]
MDMNHHICLLLLCSVLQYARVEPASALTEYAEQTPNIAEVKIILRALDVIDNGDGTSKSRFRVVSDHDRTRIQNNLRQSLMDLLMRKSRAKFATPAKRGFWFSKNPKRICQGDIFC